MRSGMFPATAKDPHTAFTINMLKDFQLHNFESKKAAYDYLGAIRRLTDNSFTADVPVRIIVRMNWHNSHAFYRTHTLLFCE
jgi:hypothetical protein